MQRRPYQSQYCHDGEQLRASKNFCDWPFSTPKQRCGSGERQSAEQEPFQDRRITLGGGERRKNAHTQNSPYSNGRKEGEYICASWPVILKSFAKLLRRFVPGAIGWADPISRVSPNGSSTRYRIPSTVNSQKQTSRSHEQSLGVFNTFEPGTRRTTAQTCRRPTTTLSISNAKVSLS